MVEDEFSKKDKDKVSKGPLGGEDEIEFSEKAKPPGEADDGEPPAKEGDVVTLLPDHEKSKSAEDFEKRVDKGKPSDIDEPGSEFRSSDKAPVSAKRTEEIQTSDMDTKMIEDVVEMDFVASEGPPHGDAEEEEAPGSTC